MRTHLRHGIDRKFSEVIADRFEVVFRRKALSQQPPDECVDDGFALLRRHIGLDGEGTMRAINQIFFD
jgi:hypothetical protein